MQPSLTPILLLRCRAKRFSEIGKLLIIKIKKYQLGVLPDFILVRSDQDMTFNDRICGTNLHIVNPALFRGHDNAWKAKIV